jgi:hypothetical protein
VPQTIDPDRWLLALTGKTHKRSLDRNGGFQLGNQTDYLQKKLHDQYGIVWLNGQRRELAIFVDRQLVKKLPSKGLHNLLMNFPDSFVLRCKEAISPGVVFCGAPPPIARSQCR